MKSTKKLVCFALLSSCLAAPALYAADNCSGYYGAEGASADTVELSKGNKATFWTSHETVSSGNSAYNGLGGCGGYTIVAPDGTGWVAGACTVVASNGDTWSYTFAEELGTGRGTWKAGNGTGQFAKASKNSGWYEHTTQAGKQDTGKWGGTCAQ